MTDAARKLAGLIREAFSVVCLSGAGVSTNAGIPDFRGPRGMYTTGAYDAEAIFKINHFVSNPLPFYDFARDFLKKIKEIKPTFTHFFFADLEKKGKLKGIITQNIDALHQKAGSKKVFEFHGSFWKSFCMNCGKEFSYSMMEEKIFKEKIPKCECGGTIKPDIVFFGQPVKFLKEAVELAFKSDLFIVVGSSLTVYPAAAIPDNAFGKIAVINRGKVNISPERVSLFADCDLDEFFAEVEKFL
ncbi:MAG: Sir2 family NAD-dependent protein deacetylase [Elusimicrobia bacterium]|nr:Sir2 family NAD-dependent protein deacetylase [Elusimicrobiota bacterium]